EKNKKVEVDEKARHSLIVGHITERIDVDKKSDAGDDKQHHRGEVIDLERKLYLERTGLDPGIEGVAKNPRSGQEPKNVQCDGKESPDRHTRQHSRTLFPQSSAEKYVEDRCQQRNQRNPPQQVKRHRALGGGYHLRNCISEGSSVWRWRKIAMMMARPTTASAAATAMTKKTITCPSIDPRKREKTMKVKFTALSISSMDIRMTMRFRRISTPMTPMAKTMALRMR